MQAEQQKQIEEIWTLLADRVRRGVSNSASICLARYNGMNVRPPFSCVVR